MKNLARRILFKKKPQVLIHYPCNWINNHNTPSVELFYRTLFKVLALEGINYTVTPTKGIPITDDLNYKDTIHLTYHTKHPCINAINIKVSYLPNLFYFDRKGYSGWSETTDDIKTKDYLNRVEDHIAKSYFEKIASHYIHNNISKYPQPLETNKHPNHNHDYIFLATQVIDDSVSELAYIDTLTLIKHATTACETLGIDLLIKRHPKCSSIEIKQTIEEATQKNHVLTTNGSIHDLIKNAEAVLTVNSGVGFESLLHLKQVYITGKADYHWACTTIKTEYELKTKLLKSKVPEDRIRQFVYYFCNENLGDCNSEESIRKQIHQKLTPLLQEKK
jgi:hypothetical protein